jgi:hypothetical protein
MRIMNIDIQNQCLLSKWLYKLINEKGTWQDLLKKKYMRGKPIGQVHVASSWRSRGDEIKDGWVDATDCIGLFYPNFIIFFVLGHKSSLVISFSYK